MEARARCQTRVLKPSLQPDFRLFSSAILLLPLLATAFLTSASAEREGVHCSVVTDQDGDEVVLMESEWISLHLLPRMQAIINRFVFRPTGNDIVEALHPKIRRMGGGLLMDCLEEQDWRFQELKEKPYPYKITKTGPEEGQVVFETDIVGWVGSDGSGIISKLLSNLTLRRTVTLRSGQPFFRFDFEFINRDRYAKRPTFWPHNSSIITLDGDETVLRPSERGILSIRGPWGGRNLTGEHYIFDFNHGWSVSMAHERKEGIVYLMDYDYVRELYNCLNSTVEWRYDSILSFQDTPWKGHIYILPIIGLSDVHYANEYFICQLNPKREEGKFVLEYRLASSYEKVAQITFNARLEYNLLEESPQSVKLKPVIFDSIGIEPVSRRVDLELDAPDPLALDLTAFVELSDGTLKTFNFETYYAGEYKGPTGPNSRRDGKPVKLLRRPVRRPRVPDVPAGLVLNRKDFNVFAVFGLGTMRLRLKEIVESIPGVKLDIGYCTGSDATGYGLGDFPYDYDRLFSYRVLLFSNIQDKEYRSIGASILLPWLQAGGGLVISGGEHAFTYELREHEINAYYPVEFKPGNLRKGACQLQQPEVQDHPIFRDLDLTDLPYLFYCHDLALKEGSDARVLMKVGGYPLIIEKRTGEQITMVVTANHFGTASDFEGKTHLRHWKEWPKLYAQIVRYAAHDLK